MIQVKIDEDLCVGTGHCEDVCPEVFRVQDRKAVVLRDPVPTDEEERVYRAVQLCPTRAISLT